MTLAVSGVTFPCHRLTVGRRSSPVQTREQSEEVRTSSLCYQSALGTGRDTSGCSGHHPFCGGESMELHLTTIHLQFLQLWQSEEQGKGVIEDKEEKQSKQTLAKHLTVGDETSSPCARILIFLLYMGIPNTNIKATIMWLFSLFLMQLDQLWYY